MNNDFIYKLYRSSKSNYNLNLLSYTPLTSKSYKVTTKDNEKYVVKKIKNKSKNKYKYLKNQGLDNIIYPIPNIEDLLYTRVTNFGCEDECYCVMPYIDDNNVLNQTKAKALLEQLSILHNKTSFNKNISLIKSKKKMEEVIQYLDYKFNIIESYVRVIEAQPFDEFSIPILKNYHYILDAKRVLIEKNRIIVNAIKSEKSVIYCFIHNNPKLDHLILSNGEKYLISIDNGVIGIPSLDIAKFYIENEDIDYDISSDIKAYFDTYEDSFYIDYFIFLVLFIYIRDLIVDKKCYICTQNFIYISNAIKKFNKSFDLIKQTEK